MDTHRNYLLKSLGTAVFIVMCSVIFNLAGPGQANGDSTNIPEENVLRLLVWENYTPEKIVEAFVKGIEAKYKKKIRFEIKYAVSPDDFYDAVRSKNVDLITITHDEIKEKKYGYIKKKLILPYDLKNVPNHVNIIPNIKDADYHTSEGRLYGMPVANGPYGLAYNTEFFKQPPKSWNVFWEPAHKNKYLLGKGQYIYNVNITAMVLGYPKEDISNFNKLNNPEFREKLKQLAMNAKDFWIGVDKPEDLLGMRCATSWSDSLSGLKRKGEIWEMASPAEGTLWWIDDYLLTAALADRPFMKMVAEKWVNKVLSSEFQVEHILREVQIYPVITGISDMLTDVERKKVKPENNAGFMNSHVLRKVNSERNRNGLKLLWDEALNARDQ